MAENQPDALLTGRQRGSEMPAGVTRRELLQIGNVLAFPVLLGGARADAANVEQPLTAVGERFSAASAAGPLKPGSDIYRSIGVEPIINCRGTFTIIGGSVELPEVTAAMESATKSFVQLDELAEAVGQRLAELTGAEWGVVTSGCAAAMKHVTAACVTGGNPEKLVRIPNLTGFDKTEVVIPRYSRNDYDAAIRNIGVTIITVDSPEELASALNPRTAMIYIFAGPESESGPLSLEAIARIAQPKGAPILVDAAAEVLTIPNVHLQRGAAVVAYSGGKCIRGPQCAGLALGRKDILLSTWQASSPHHGPGRDNKVGREEALGMLAAVEAWVKRDHEGEWKQWLSWLDTISKRVTKVEGVTTTVKEPTELSNRSPSLVISWDPVRLHITGEEVADVLARTKPRIAVGGPDPKADPGTTSVSVTAWMMQPGEDKIVADRIYRVLEENRQPRSTTMAAPAADIGGRWDVEIQFFSSKETHTWSVEQDANWVQGTHQGEFSTRDIAGLVEADVVKLRSVEVDPGWAVPFIFAGKLAGDTIFGDVYMGEYLNATFKATRHAYSTKRTPIRIPTGRPLPT
jgi:D-glucosaminate-6-phosphate ammonia-lyase